MYISNYINNNNNNTRIYKACGQQAEFDLPTFSLFEYKEWDV